MEHAAIVHYADSRYCFALEKGKFMFRLETKKDDLKQVMLYMQDKYIPIHMLDTRTRIEMKKAGSDQYKDYYEITADIDVICLRYYFELTDKEGNIEYFGNHSF